MTSSQTKRNTEIALKFLDDIGHLRMDELHRTFHDEGRYWSAGTESLFPFAGTYNKEGLMDVMKRTLEEVNSTEPEESKIFGTTAEGDRVAVESMVKRTNVHGELYEQHYHFLFVIKDDQVVLFKQYFDTGLAAQNFRTLKPKSHLKID